MKILFDCHVPFLLAHGGAQIQLEQTKAAIESLGIEIEYLRWWDDGQKGDLIHFFGRALQSHVRLAQQKGMKYVQSELLTSQGSRSLLRLRLEGLRNRVVSHFGPSQLSAAWQPYRLADASIALTPWEARLMEVLYMAPKEKIYVVPNGVEEEFFSAQLASNARQDYLVCTATITERKRIVELAQAAISAQVPLWIIGKPYAESDPYFRTFLDLQRRHSSVIRFEGPIADRKKLASIYQSARGFVLLSTMESLSLSALEAAAGGCPLLLSDLPWARCTFGSSASYCPITSSVSVAASELKRFSSGADRLPVPPKPMRWTEVAVLLQDVYRKVLTQTRDR